MSESLSVKSLSARLVEQLEQERRMLESEQKVLLEQHASALKRLSESALSTARAAMEAETKALQERLSEIVRRLSWITLAISVPVVIAMLLVVGLAILAAQHLLPLRLVGQVEVMEAEGARPGARVLVLRGEGWRMCRLPDKRLAPCLYLERKGK